jgi:rSAM/selenodomain-associated transferase 1
MSVTLGMMARAPVPGRCKTRLAATLGDEAAAKLYAAMIADSFDRYSRAGASRNVVVAAPEHDGVRLLAALCPPGWEVVPQVGTGLGERLANAFRTLKIDGAAVVLVGSDSPTLPVEPLAAAFRGFSGAGRVLLGPTDDGGYYLIGLSSLELEILRDVPWSTARVMRVTLARCAALSLTTDVLPTWYDVDEGRDLERLCAELSTSPGRAPRCADVLRELRLLRADR